MSRPRTAESPRVLVIDDEPGFRELLSVELGGQGCEVAAAADGVEGLAAARAGEFDVVVSDLTMPRQGGADTLRALKELDPTLEVIIATGYATLESAVECMKRGAYDFITKPFQPEDLARLVGRAAEKRRLSRRVGELEEINRFKSEFLANMSHELRTPLNSILGYTSLHLDGVYGGVSEAQTQALQKVAGAGKSLLQLINGVLDLSKAAAGRMPVHLEDFSLRELVVEVLGMLECLAAPKGLALTPDVPADLTLRSDRTKVKQILVNLTGNAVKFTDLGGVTVLARAQEGSVLLQVVDTGIGIRPEHLPLLFQEFRQVDASPTRQFGGTGLGLALCRRFAELLGGSVGVESAPGRGSVFSVRLPLGPVSVPCPPRTLRLPPGPSGRTLLAIDDDPEMLALMSDSLHGTDYGFVGAQTGTEGLALARQLKPFAITLDIMMPHRDGWSVLQALKEDPALRGIPVLMVSILDDKALGFSLGVTDYIVKPFERRELLDALRELEDQHA